MHISIIDLEQVKVILGHLVHFPEKGALLENGSSLSEMNKNLGLWGVFCMHLLTLNMSRSLGHPVPTGSPMGLPTFFVFVFFSSAGMFCANLL